jgi:hypothetical protein
VLLVDANEVRRDLLGYALEVGCSPLCPLRVLRYASMEEALAASHGLEVRALIAAWTPDMGLEQAMQAHPEMKTLVIGYDSQAWRETSADVYLPQVRNLMAEIRERLRILCARKRGPKTVEISMEERKTA